MSVNIDGEKVEALVEGLDAMLDHMNDSYREWMKTDDPNKKRMCSEYHASLTYYMGKKYVKVVTNESVCAFVVACENDKKFEFGDILKPAGWRAPARNFRRGNVLDRSFDRVRWTGAL
jgi:hypothetical protein